MRDPRHHVRRRNRAAQEGRHLPSCSELFGGSPFLGGSLAMDAGTWAERVAERITGETVQELMLKHALGFLTVTPSAADFERVLSAYEAVVVSGASVPDMCDGPLRCSFYLACCGSAIHALRTAAAAAGKAADVRTGEVECVDLVSGALGWLANVGQRWRGLADTRIGAYQDELGELAAPRGRRLLDHATHIRMAELEARAAKPDEPPAAQRATPEPPQKPAAGTSGAVVVRQIAADHTSDGRAIKKAFEHVVGKRLSLAPVPDLAEVRSALADAFPHATGVTDTLLSGLVGQQHVRLRPAILVGEPGAGKTQFAGRLLSLLKIPFEVYGCGGVADASLAGTARRWSSGEPSLPLDLVRRHRTASPGIVLDEVEKVASGSHNGSLLSALLGLLEPASAVAWHDPYVQGAVDLSNVVWLATANSVTGLSRPFLDRCQILRFPSPGPEHLDRLAHAVLADLVSQRGGDPRWVPPLAPDEIDALRRAWPGGSIRALARLVEGVVRARDQGVSTH